MLGAHAVVDAVEPGLQIAEDEMDDRHELLGHLGIAAFGNGVMVIAARPQATIATPIVGDDQRARHDGALDEPAQGIGAAVGGDGKANATGIATVLALVLRGAGRAVANFNSSGNQRLVVDASALAARPSADPRFVDFDMLARRAADPVLIGPHHTSAQFVQDSEGGFISRQPKLPLELHPRHAGGLTGDQIGGPKPDAEWRMAALHDSADQEPGLASARAALQNAGPGDDAKGFANCATMPADKAVRPTGMFKINCARRVIGKLSLELRQRLGESQIFALVNVHGGHQASRRSCSEQTLALGGVCVNRIGTV